MTLKLVKNIVELVMSMPYEVSMSRNLSNIHKKETKKGSPPPLQGAAA